VRSLLPSKETVASYLQTWLAGAQPSLPPMTFQSYESIIRTQLVPRLGRIGLSRLRPQHLQRMEGEMLSGGLSPNYVRNVHGVLHRALDRAVQWRRLPANPRRRSRPSAAQVARDERTLTRACAHSPRGARGGPAPGDVTLMLTTGLRQGGLRALRWRDVDPEAGRLSIIANLCG
jgi:integrase